MSTPTSVPPNFGRRSRAEPPPDPAVLSRTAAELSAAVTDDEFGRGRAQFLRAHLDALAVGGRRLAGEQISFVGEVHSYFQVEIAERPDRLVRRGARPDLRAAGWQRTAGGPLVGVPRCGPLPAGARRSRRFAPWPPRCGADRGPVGLPAGEHIDFEIAADAAWSGFNYYLGGLRSRVAVNAGVGHRISQLPVLTAHECYPGHHTEHCRKEALLIQGDGQLEHSHLPGEHPPVPDGRGSRRPGVVRRRRARAGGAGPPRYWTASDHASTRTWSRRSRSPPAR